ncbi:hypothetical protein Tco_1255451 [Tanacetum coccineum]
MYARPQTKEGKKWKELAEFENDEEDKEVNVNMVFMAKLEKVVSDSNEHDENGDGSDASDITPEAWELWNKGRGLEFMDAILENPCSHTQPKRPAFFIERHEAEATRDDSLGNGYQWSINFIFSGKIEDNKKVCNVIGYCASVLKELLKI